MVSNVKVAECFLLSLFLMQTQGRKIKCSTSQAKHRLFIGNVPRSWGEEDIKKVVTEIGPGVTAVELVKVSVIVTLSSIIVIVSGHVYLFSLPPSLPLFISLSLSLLHLLAVV